MGNPSEVRRSRSMKTKKGAQHVERMYQKVDRKKGEKNSFILRGKGDTFGQSVTPDRTCQCENERANCSK